MKSLPESKQLLKQNKLINSFCCVKRKSVFWWFLETKSVPDSRNGFITTTLLYLLNTLNANVFEVHCLSYFYSSRFYNPKGLLKGNQMLKNPLTKCWYFTAKKREIYQNQLSLCLITNYSLRMKTFTICVVPFN